MFRLPRAVMMGAACCLLTINSVASTYYVDSDGGSDSNTGASPGAAWATLDKANAKTFQPGDRMRNEPIWRWLDLLRRDRLQMVRKSRE